MGDRETRPPMDRQPERKMFLLEADDRFWYAAPSAEEAANYHRHHYEDDEVEVGDFVEQPPDKVLTVTDVDEGHKITATVAEWIRWEENSEGGRVREIASTIY